MSLIANMSSYVVWLINEENVQAELYGYFISSLACPECSARWSGLYWLTEINHFAIECRACLATVNLTEGG